MSEALSAVSTDFVRMYRGCLFYSHSHRDVVAQNPEVGKGAGAGRVAGRRFFVLVTVHTCS